MQAVQMFLSRAYYHKEVVIYIKYFSFNEKITIL